MYSIIKVMKKVKIKTKIVIVYIITLLVSVGITFIVLSNLNEAYIEKEVGVIGSQAVNALGGNLNLIFDNVTQYSDYIYFDDDVQNALKKSNSKIIDAEKNRKITKSLVNTIVAGDYISGVFVIDKHNNCYNSYKKAPKQLNPDKVMETKWYSELESHNGNGFFIHNNEGIIEYWENNDYITYVREIRDKNTYESLAILLVTIDPECIKNYFREVHKSYESEFCIVDSSGQFIVKPEEYGTIFEEYLSKASWDREDYQMCDINGEKHMVIVQDIGIQDWKLIGIFGMNAKWTITPYYSTLVISILCLNVVFVFVGSVLLTDLIFKPLSKVEKHMRMVDGGSFVLMQVGSSENEITSLQRIYNGMTESIQNLMIKIKEEEQIIAKNELDIIRAQINPHFLYNTLDAVSALALMKEHESCFKMTQALGNFYRNSLNSGLDYISIKDEIECIKSYITILNIRYENKIKITYDVDENVLDEKILKLILQPLVENAVYHGIKENFDWGSITIKIFEADDEIILIVSDDGKGMSEERVNEVLTGKSVTGKSGFGLYSLKQRISLYYGIEEPIIINSEIGIGTEITVSVKRRGEL